MNHKPIAILFFFFISCKFENSDYQPKNNQPPITEFNSVGDIPLPAGFKRVEAGKDSFGSWLRNISLKKDKLVHLYNGGLKKNQSIQFAVLDIPVGKKDLQQCADAVMRLRAEYLYSHERFQEIEFTDNAGICYLLKDKANRTEFEDYLERVFGWCGSASLEKQLKPVDTISQILPGDVFIRGGFPGHAMIVVDAAVNNKGEKIYLLAQSYMPAQDIHIVKNPLDIKLSPWYKADTANEIFTPEWKFYKNQLRRW
jgi:hypothetical protein